MTKEPYYWLNKDSRKFLERGYLLEGETPEQRFKDIAQTAEKYLKIKGFADKFEDYLSRGFYSISSPIISNFGRKRGLPISCVTGDTWINTKENGGKLAKDIQIGDEVLTHKGRYKKVIDVIPTKNRKGIYKLKVASRLTPLHLTGDHLVLTNLGWVRTDELDKQKHFVAVNGDIDIVEEDYAIDLKPFCKRYEPCVVEGQINKQASKKTRKTKSDDRLVDYVATPPEYVEVDEDLAWAFGVWFAEGSVGKTFKKQPSGIGITFNNKDEKPLGERWLKIISEKFNIYGKLTESFIQKGEKTNSWCNVNVNSHIIGELFASFGNGCKEKVIPQWIINLPKPKLAAFLDALLAGDGTINKKTKNVSITLANPRLLLQIYQIGLKLGMNMSIQMQQKAGKLATVVHVYNCMFKQYKLGTNKSDYYTGIKFTDGLYYVPIREIAITDRIEDVYDFTVEEDHSFSATGVILHNCFGSYVPDTLEGIMHKVAEVGVMTKHGGGTSAYFGDIRPRGTKISSGGESTGSVHFMELYNKLMNVVSQGNVRRGSFAAYLPIDHGDIEEFLEIRSEGHDIQEMSFAVTVSDQWMKEMVAGDKDKRRVWSKVIKKRFESGYPYITFIDTLNNNKPQVYKDKGLIIHAQNLCNEISLPSSEDESFVCDLSSLNLEKWDEIKNTDAIQTLVYFLDAVMSEFIDKTEGMQFMEAPRKFAIRHRALGVGVLGWHSFLQSKMVAFESFDAKMLNVEIWKTIKERADKATEELAEIFGEPELLKGYGRRNTTTLAIAPTTSCTTPDTNFIDGGGNVINYWNYCQQGGIDLREIMSITVFDEDNNSKKFNYDEKVNILRSNEKFSLFAYELKEGDQIL